MFGVILIGEASMASPRLYHDRDRKTIRLWKTFWWYTK